MVVKSSHGKHFILIWLFWVFINRFPSLSSRHTFSFGEILEKTEFNTPPETAKTPSFSTLAGISISIPKFKFVDRSFKDFPEAVNKIEFKIGKVKFFPVILST